MSDSTTERTVKAANITPNATEDVIRTLFEFLGPVTHLQLKDSPYNDGSLEATIEFQDHQAAMTALHLSGTELGDRILVISFHSRVTTLKESEPSVTAKNNVVFVYQLSPNVTTNDLPVLFGACGPIGKLSLQEDPQHAPNLYATIEFTTKQGADAAIHFNGRVLKDKSIKVCRSNELHSELNVKEEDTATDNATRRKSRESQTDSSKGHSIVRKRSKSGERSSYSARRAYSKDRHSSRRRHDRSTGSHDRYHYSRLSSREHYYYESSSRRRSRERRYHHYSPSSSRRRSYYYY